MVAKHRDHPYRSGRPDWVGVKNPKRPQKITFDKMREWLFAASWSIGHRSEDHFGEFALLAWSFSIYIDGGYHVVD